MIFNQQTPKKQTFNPICETYEKLKLIEKQLGRMNLLNNKYLYKRNSIYYFSIKLNNQTIKKSLQTTNFVYANILKYKIIYRLDKMDIKYNLNNMFIVQRAGDNINIIPENEAEKKLLDTVEASANNIVKRLSNKYDNVITNDYDKRVQLTLKQCGEEFLKSKSKTSSVKTMSKYTQCMDYLYVYFGENTKLSKLSVQNASRFRTFLIDVPKNYKKQDDLKNKDIKLLIENNSKLLLKYEKQIPTTIDEVIKRVKTIFTYFTKNQYLPHNIFNDIEKLSKNYRTKWREFKVEEYKQLIEYLNKQGLKEECNFFKFALMTGLRRGEILQLKKEHLHLEKDYIDTEGVKTTYAKRIVPIHKNLLKTILNQLKDKDNDDFLFFNHKKDLISREEKIGTELNNLILKVVGKEEKEALNIHSFRKNFSQEIFLSDLFKELDYKTIIGHSTRSDITDKHYIRGKRDYKKLKEKMDNVDFSEYIGKEVLPKIKDNNINLNFI